MPNPEALIRIDGDTRRINDLKLPADRANRDAWVFNGDVVEVDPAKVSQLAEAEVQRTADERTSASDADVALAETVIDLVMAAVDNPATLKGRTKEQVKTLFRKRFVENLRSRKSL